MSFIKRRFVSRRLGSRLYYEFTEAALSNEAEWERLADSVAMEERRSVPVGTGAGTAAHEGHLMIS